MSPLLPARAALLAAALLLAPAAADGAAAPPDAERGFPLLEVVAPGPADADPQSFSIARDPRGALYVANGAGLLIYDGAWWRRIEIGRARTAFSVATDDAGRVAVGGTDDFGILEPDATGTPRFRSLVPLVPAQHEVSQVMQVRPVPDGFLFLTRKWLFRWNGRSITVLAAFPGDRPYGSLFAVEGEVYLWRREAGLLVFAGDRLAPVPGGASFRDRRIDTLLPFAPRGGPGRRDLLVSVRGEGLFRLAADGRVEPFAPEASRWTAEKRILPGGSLRLPDGRWALGSILGGLLLLRPDGTVDRVIDSRAGLPDDFVGGVVLDREGTLWLALNTGLARVEVASPLSVVDARSGLEGSIFRAVRHRGRLWVTTSNGLVAADDPPPGGGGLLRMHAVPGIPPSGWGLVSVGDDLLVGTGFGIFRVRGDRPDPAPILGGEQGVAYILTRSRRDPDLVWAGMDSGLAALRRTRDGWHMTLVPGTPRELRTVVEGDDGTVWCGSVLDGLAAVEIPPRGSARIHSVIPTGEAMVYRIGGGLLAVVADRVLRVDPARKTLVEDPALAPLGGRGRVHTLAEDAAGTLWLNTRPPSMAYRQGGGWGSPRPVVEVPARAVENFLTEPDGVVWLASERGLYRYAGGPPGAESTAAALPPPQLSRVTIGARGRRGGAGEALFGGAPGAVPPAPVLPPDVRRLRIDLAPFSFRPGLRYQTWLSPLDTGWSTPSAEPFAELTRLPPNDYTFRLRTVAPDGRTSPETAWSFRVRPPWHQTSWALGLGLLLLLAGVRVYGGLRHRALRQRAAELEARVAAQTDQLQHTVEELRQAHAGLAAANVRLEELSRSDDLTGIANRRRLQEQLKVEWERALADPQPIAFVLIDLDHFKRLNDTRGHGEGDLCLQRVARYLDAAVGDGAGLVARYGGEEFAVLLPGLDLAGGEREAERLRRGLESLALPHEAAPTGRITASFGVAAWVPQTGEKPESLIEDADLALYRAKSEGRNRVCAAAA